MKESRTDKPLHTCYCNNMRPLHNYQSIKLCPPPPPPVVIGRGLFNYYVGTTSPQPYEGASDTYDYSIISIGFHGIMCICPPLSGRDEPCPNMFPHRYEHVADTYGYSVISIGFHRIMCMCPPLSDRDEPCSYMFPHPWFENTKNRAYLNITRVLIEVNV